LQPLPIPFLSPSYPLPIPFLSHPPIQASQQAIQFSKDKQVRKTIPAAIIQEIRHEKRVNKREDRWNFFHGAP